jgi:soluble lytic murein transglycosylase
MRLLLLFFPIYLFAFGLNEILSHPKSHIRDFYLTNFLKDTNSPILAYKAYQNLNKPKSYHLKLLAKKNPSFQDVYNCSNLNESNFKKYPIFCIVDGGLSFWSISNFSNENLEYLEKILPKKSNLKKPINILKTENFKEIFRDKNLFFKFYLTSSYKTRKKLDILIDKNFLNSVKNDKRFYSFVAKYVRSNFENIKKSLLSVNYHNIQNRNVNFLLALNAINFNEDKKAINFLKSSKIKNNQINFWLYQLTKNEYYLNELLKKTRVDFYTLYAYDKVGRKFNIRNKIVFDTIKNPKYNINNPFDIKQFFEDFRKKENLFEFAKKLDNSKTLPLKQIVLDKAFRYKYNFFITPDYDLSGLSISQKALFFAIAKQESRFVPAVLSRSYAVGVMQMMPFLIRAMKKDESIYDFFKAHINVKYAKKHLLWLDARLNHPIFIAYAYNGGIGFTKRDVIPTFKFKGKYEPYLSMEMVSYAESRHYAKKVISNYVIYSRILGDSKVNLLSLLQSN